MTVTEETSSFELYAKGCASEDAKERAFASRMACVAAARHLARFRGGTSQKDEPQLEALLRSAGLACREKETSLPRSLGERGDAFEEIKGFKEKTYKSRTSLASLGFRMFALHVHDQEDQHLRQACRTYWKLACAGCPWAAQASMPDTETDGEEESFESDAKEEVSSSFSWEFDLNPEGGAIPLDFELIRPMCEVLAYCSYYGSEETKKEATRALYALDARATAELCPEMMLLAGSLARQM